jgi:hypothetical protein
VKLPNCIHNLTEDVLRFLGANREEEKILLRPNPIPKLRTCVSLTLNGGYLGPKKARKLFIKKV